MVKVSPLPMENQYHPLFDHNGEEDIHIIIVVSPPLIVRLVPPPVTRALTIGLRLVL